MPQLTSTNHNKDARIPHYKARNSGLVPHQLKRFF